MERTESRLPCLTALRGVAALCVLMHHFTGWLLPNTGDFLITGTSFVRRSYLLVDFFFILSGFLMAHLYQDAVNLRSGLLSYRGFLRTRFARLYPLHVLTLLAMLGLNIGMVAAEIRNTGLTAYLDSDNFQSLRFYGNDSVLGFVRHLLLLQTINSGGYTDWNGPAWSIGAEWIAYVLFPILAALPCLGRKAAACTLVLGMAGIVVLAQQFAGSLDLGGLYGSARCLLEFSMGIALTQFFRSRTIANCFAGDAPMALALGAAVASIHFDVPAPLAVAAFALVVISGASNRGTIARWCDSRLALWLGDISYAVYMLHWPLLSWLRWLWKGVFRDEFGASFDLPVAFAVVAVATAATLGLATITHKWIEVPWRRRLRGSRP